VEYRETNIY